MEVMEAAMEVAEVVLAEATGSPGQATDSMAAEPVDSRVADRMDFTAAAAIDLMAEAMGTTTAEAIGTTADTVDIMETTTDTMADTADIMETTTDTMADTTNTIGMVDTDTTAAAGGFRGSLVLVGVIRGMAIRTMGIPTTAPTMAIHMGVTTAAITAVQTMEMGM